MEHSTNIHCSWQILAAASAIKRMISSPTWVSVTYIFYCKYLMATTRILLIEKTKTSYCPVPRSKRPHLRPDPDVRQKCLTIIASIICRRIVSGLPRWLQKWISFSRTTERVQSITFWDLSTMRKSNCRTNPRKGSWKQSIWQRR